MAEAQAATSQAKSPKAAHHLTSGALSGLTSAVCLQPLDLLKTRLQQGNTVGRKRHRLGAVVRQVVRDDGVTGLWRGTVPTVARNVPGVALYFYMLSAIRHELTLIPYFARGGSGEGKRSALAQLSPTGNLCAGAVARTSVGFVLNPITVIKARFESNAYTQYRSLVGAFRHLLAADGVRGLFQGFTATAVRDAPYAGLYVVFYEKGKELAGKALSLRPELSVPNAALHSGSAVSASVLATVLTSPADCVKTRMQVAPAENPSILRAVRHIYADLGFAGFFAGSSLRVSRKAASSAIAWTVYEGLLLMFRARDKAIKATTAVQ
ncbi:mitochondrial carrier [Cutaneotrichosporon oleaginosum]|uniref:Mitochondrial glycine transporter n=1 Tax=Cutaneotrichosporon oleaginosum TaxID=879819 RepID=A0A0J1B0P5_9TREE|nr:mitochondrial carrier [Cutaneotrichosporon oleaginosum]KLT41184.1 mitochondrial carrier [Cutaneotrichosporon oleaginosum]